MYKRLTLSLAMLAVGAAMLAASGIASTGSAHKQSASQGSVAKKGGILKASLFAGVENIDPQRSYYVPEWQYEWLTARPLLNFLTRWAPGVTGCSTRVHRATPSRGTDVRTPSTSVTA